MSVRPLLAGLLLTALHAGEAVPPVPDPLGLGPRLALLDFLQSEWRIKPPEKATYQELCHLYWAEHRRRNPPVAAPDPAEEAARNERIRALASKLLARGLTVPAEADEAMLQTMLEQAEKRKNEPTEPEPTSGQQTGEAKAVDQPADKPVDKAAGRPAEKPASPGDWKGQLSALWKAREEQIPADPDLGWTIEQPELSHVANRYRLRRAGGEYAFDDRPPAKPEDGLEVWMNIAMLEPSGFGTAVARFQTERWRKAWWDAPAREWSAYPPAQRAWVRDSQASQRIFAGIIDGPGDGSRSAAWRTLHQNADAKQVIDTGQIDPALAALFASVQTAHGGVALPLVEIEAATHQHERLYRLVKPYEETLIAAQNAARGSVEDETVKRAFGQLERLGRELNAVTVRRRELLRECLVRIGVSL